VRRGDKIDVTAEVSDVQEPGDKVRLRLVLVEGWVGFTGSNGLPYHHHVVRAMPGGPDGIGVAKKAAKQSAAVDLGELRDQLNQYLDKAAQKRDIGDLPRPMDFRRLYVVAFVQNDETKEVLQAVQVDVPPAAAGR
jgi:hypothetical protein